MDVNKAAYWIALGALALNGGYRQGGFATLHRVAERADAPLSRIFTRAEQAVAVVRALTGRDGTPADNLQASTDAHEMARAQGEMLRERVAERAELLRDEIREQVRGQADGIRALAEMRRAEIEQRRGEIEQIRSRTRSQFSFASTTDHRIMVVCPKTGTRVVVNARPDFADVSDNVNVEDEF